MLVNVTPHALIILSGEEARVLPPSGVVARVALTRENAGSVDGVPVTRATFGALEGLPEAQDGVVFVASLLAAQAAKDIGRSDVLAPGELVRGPDGQPLGCRGLTRP